MSSIPRTVATALIAAAILAGCATTPAALYNKEVTTLGQVDMTGLVCRTDQVTGSIRKKTYCASPEMWARYDARMRDQSDAIYDISRSATKSRR
jgi:hypothetical protein